MSGSRGPDDKKDADLSANELASLRNAGIKPVPETPPATSAGAPPPLPPRPPKRPAAINTANVAAATTSSPPVSPAPASPTTAASAAPIRETLAELWMKIPEVVGRLNVELPERFNAVKSELTEQEIAELGKYLEPFQNPALTNHPYIRPQDFGTLSFQQKVNALYSQVSTKSRVEFEASLMGLAKQFYYSYACLGQITKRVDAILDQRIKENLQKKVPSITEQAYAVKKNLKEIGDLMSEPHQYLARFTLWNDAIIKEFLKAEKISDPEALSEKIKTTPEDDLSDQEKAYKQLDVLRGVFKADATQANFLQIEREMYPFADAFKGVNSKTLPQAFDRALANKDPIARAQGIAMAYIDTYINERSLSLTQHTVKSSALNLVEKYISAALNIKDETKLDTQILHQVDGFPDRNKIISHVFERAVIEILVNKNQQAYANALKVIDRIGMRAVTKWNELATEKLGADSPKMLINVDPKSPHLTERQIKDKFNVLVRDDTFKSNLSTKFFASILAHQLKSQDTKPLQPDQLMKLTKLTVKLLDIDEKKTDPKFVFLEAYLDAYISERTKQGGHTAKGPLLTLIEKASADFIRNSGIVPTKEKGKEDAMILSLVETLSDSQKNEITKKLVKYVIESVNNHQQSEFANVFKAVKRMNLIDEWDKLIGVANLKIKDNKTLGTSIEENNIVKLFEEITSSPPASPSPPSLLSPTSDKSDKGFFAKRRAKLSISSGQPSPSESTSKSPKSPTTGLGSDSDSPRSKKR